MLLPTVETMVGVLYFGLVAISCDFISGSPAPLVRPRGVRRTGAYTDILIANGKLPLLGPGTPFMLSLLVGGLIAVVLRCSSASSRSASRRLLRDVTLGVAQVFYGRPRLGLRGDQPPRRSGGRAKPRRGLSIGVPGSTRSRCQRRPPATRSPRRGRRCPAQKRPLHDRPRRSGLLLRLRASSTRR